MQNQLRYLIFGVSVLSMLIPASVRAEVKEKLKESQNIAQDAFSDNFQLEEVAQTAQSREISTADELGLVAEAKRDSEEIGNAALEPSPRMLNESKFLTPVSNRAKEVAQATLRVTGVELNPTAEGLGLILKTTGEKLPESFETRFGETLIIDLINTQLQLPEGNRFVQENPTAGIASVEVIQQYTNTVMLA